MELTTQTNKLQIFGTGLVMALIVIGLSFAFNIGQTKDSPGNSQKAEHWEKQGNSNQLATTKNGSGLKNPESGTKNELKPPVLRPNYAGYFDMEGEKVPLPDNSNKDSDEDSEKKNYKLSIKEIEPNPFHKQFKINFTSNPQPLQFSLKNLKGEIVYEGEIQANRGNNNFQFSKGKALKNGLYTLELKGENSHATKKLVRR